jgi:hypothetical protein
MNKNNYTEATGKMAGALSLTELGLGSILHSFKIPLAGQILSINQIAMLSRISFKLKNKKSSLQVSIISSLLKSLSPAGKKLTPMLAIAAQGLLYYLGLTIFGLNYLGLFVAVLMSSLWAFIQPVLFIYLLFGKSSVDVVQYFILEFEKIVPITDRFIWGIFAAAILIKFLVSFVIAVIAIKINDRQFNHFQRKMVLKINTSNTIKKGPPAWLAFRDLINPLFLVSFGMTIIFFVFAQSSTSTTYIFWCLLRPIALGYLLFYCIRVYPVHNFSNYLHQKGFSQLAAIFDVAIKTIQDTRDL